MKHQPNVFLNVYLVLEHNNQLLLLLRDNTGYGDGLYNLVAGHVEHFEQITSAIVRETKEEANIVIDPNHLKMIHVNHHVSDRENIDVFLHCTQ